MKQCSQHSPFYQNHSTYALHYLDLVIVRIDWIYTNSYSKNKGKWWKRKRKGKGVDSVTMSVLLLGVEQSVASMYVQDMLWEEPWSFLFPRKRPKERRELFGGSFFEIARCGGNHRHTRAVIIGKRTKVTREVMKSISCQMCHSISYTTGDGSENLCQKGWRRTMLCTNLLLARGRSSFSCFHLFLDKVLQLQWNVIPGAEERACSVY